jgi:hypothetical protein
MGKASVMPKVKQISAWVADRPGMLGQVADALGAERVNIRAFMATVVDGRGFVRVVVDKPAAARRIFRQHSWDTTEDDLVEVTIPDRPGALGAVADRLGAAGISIQYAYVGTAKGAGKVNLYLAVPDVKRALGALRQRADSRPSPTRGAPGRSPPRRAGPRRPSP